MYCNPALRFIIALSFTDWREGAEALKAENEMTIEVIDSCHSNNMQPKQVQVLERPGNLMQRLRCELSFFSITVALDNCVFGAFQSSPPQSGFTRASRWEWSKAIRVDNRMWRIEDGRCWAETLNPLHKISWRHQKAIPSSPKALGSSAVSALVKSVNTLQKNWAINIRSWFGGGV